MAPYCHVLFDYEARPDPTFAHHPSGLRTDTTVRLASIIVKTGTFENFRYLLDFETSHQSGRSLLSSIRKQMPGGWETQPTAFQWDGFGATEPRWIKSAGTTLPTYHGTLWDASHAGINSLISTHGTTIRLDGDVSRAVPLAPPWAIQQGHFIEFMARGDNLRAVGISGRRGPKE